MSDVEELEEYEEEEKEQKDDEAEKKEEPTRPKTTYVPNMAPPKLPDGEKVDFDDLHRKRLEKDFNDLQTLIELHFTNRQKEEEELIALQNRIERRRSDRAEQQRVHAEQERERQARLTEERTRREEEAAKLRAEEEAKKKKIFNNKSYGSYLQKADQKRGKKLTAREEKKKALMERRKPLIFDHLSQENLVVKVQDLWQWLYQLHAETFELAEKLKRQKYEIYILRNRVSDHQRGSKTSKTSCGAKGRSGSWK
ncbi:troponin T2c, cardiac [Thalassophryne amazonica]|uniref:troponin T2c, cardiac n=1 Tax=Thalassophryne amazonica TaxID=390379 RepID=UPI0014724C2A|nr:troponin T2c, cardiac [Thalassophryne amazonica]